MPLFQDNTCAFIIRIWLEPREIEGASAKWRGMIEHLQSGERRYVEELDDIIDFVVPCLEGLGVRLNIFWRARQWLKRWNQ